MTIITKYNIGDELYTVHNNKIIKTKIIKPSFKEDYTNTNFYNLEKMLGWKLEAKEHFMGMETNITRLETELFLTKEELLKSL